MFTPLTNVQVLRNKKRLHIPGEDHLFLVINSSRSGVSQLIRFTDFLKRYWNIEEELFVNMHIVLTEAVQNAARHGNRSSPSRTVCITATRDDDYYAFTVEDEGEGFDHAQIKDPTEERRLKKAGGRGIFIMAQLADFIHFSNEGKCVKLLFYRKK